MGRHHRPDELTVAVPRPQLVVTMRAIAPRPPLPPTTVVTATPTSAAIAGRTLPPRAPAPTPVVAPSPAIASSGPPGRVGWWARHVGRRGPVERDTLAGQLARAQRRARQVSSASVNAGASGAVGSPRRSAEVGPAGALASDARPPWRSETPSPELASV